jgi:hypothetical protein
MHLKPNYEWCRRKFLSDQMSVWTVKTKGAQTLAHPTSFHLYPNNSNSNLNAWDYARWYTVSCEV